MLKLRPLPRGADVTIGSNTPPIKMARSVQTSWRLVKLVLADHPTCPISKLVYVTEGHASVSAYGSGGQRFIQQCIRRGWLNIVYPEGG